MIPTNLLRILVLAGFSPIALAVSQPQSLGWMASSMYCAALGATAIIHTICLLIGIGLITAGLLRFKERHHIPDEVPLRAPILIMLLGLAFIALSFLPMPK